MNKHKVESLVSLFMGALLFFIFICIIGIGLDKLSGYWDTPSVVIVAGVAYAAMIAGHRIKCVAMLPKSFLGFTKNKTDAEEAMSCFTTGAIAAFLSGITCTVIGLCNMLSHSGMEPKGLLHGFAIALLTIFWGTLFSLILFVGRARARQALLNMQDENRDEPIGSKTKLLRHILTAIGAITITFVTINLIVVIVMLMSATPDPHLTFINDTENDIIASGFITAEDIEKCTSDDDGLHLGLIYSRQDRRHNSLYGFQKEVYKKLASRKGILTVHIFVDDKKGNRLATIEEEWVAGEMEFIINLSDYLPAQKVELGDE